MAIPAKGVSVNLLAKEDEESPIGRIITWATTYGRYIMVATEIVVLLAFISRFSLDRKLTDLNESIAQKQAIIEANIPFEQEIRSLQEQLNQVKTYIAQQEKPSQTLALLKNLMPSDVYITSLNLTGENMTASAIAGSTPGFTTLINNLQATKQFTRIDIGDIKRQPLRGIEFQFTVRLVPEKKPVAIKESTGKTEDEL